MPRLPAGARIVGKLSASPTNHSRRRPKKAATSITSAPIGPNPSSRNFLVFAFNEGRDKLRLEETQEFLEDGSTSVTDSSPEDLSDDIAMGIESPITLSVPSAPKEQNDSDNEEAVTSVNKSFSVASSGSDTAASKSGVAKELFYAKASNEELNAMSGKEVEEAMCCLARVIGDKVELQDGRNLVLEGSLNEKRSLNTVLKAKLEKSDERSAFLEAELKIARDQLKTSDVDLANATKAILQLKQDMDQAEVQVASRGAELVRLCSAQKISTDRTSQLQHEVDGVTFELRHTTHLLRTTENKLHNAEVQVVALKDEAQGLINQLEDKDKASKAQECEIAGLENTVKGLGESVTEKSSLLMKYAGEISDLKEKNEFLEYEIGLLREKITTLRSVEKERDALKVIVDALQNYIRVIGK